MDNDSLSKELKRRVKKDQDMRNKFLKYSILMDKSIDNDNTEYMKKLIAQNGWPKISDFGQRVSENAWLLVQHADQDHEFQKKCLKLLKSLPKNEIDQRNVAFLEDRVLTAEGKPQLYGTQFSGIKTITVKPVKDMQNLDKRRNRMGLEPFAEYEKFMNKNSGK